MIGLAQGSLWLALLCVALGVTAYVRPGAARGNGATTPANGRGRLGFSLAAAFTMLASVLLAVFFVTGRYELDYVHKNSSSDLPFLYRFSAVWAGQEGSFLLWAFWLGLVGVALARSARKNEAAVMPFYGLVYSFVLLMTALVSPFRATGGPRAEGLGLNPILQDPWMALHPPMLFLGYALMVAPFAMAMAALARRDYQGWTRPAAPWVIAAAMAMATALSMGGHWAYRTLGWGGFWGWDPVENASLVPMLCAVALLHGLLLQRGKDAPGQRINLFVAITGFMSVMYASYLTRSGALAEFSNHSFSKLPHGGVLLAGTLAFLALGYGAYAWRFRSIPAPPAFSSLMSRASGFYLAIILLMISAALIAVGTSAPILTGLTGRASTVNVAFYNWTMAPVGILLALMLALYPTMVPGEDAARRLRNTAAPALALALAATVAVVLTGPKGREAVRVFGGAGLAFAGVFALALNLRALASARRGGWSAVGGHLAHVGVGTLILGVVASALYTRTARVKLSTVQPARAFGYTLAMVNDGEEIGPLRVELPVRVTRENARPAVARAGFLPESAGRHVVRPALAIDRHGNQMTSPGIASTFQHDLYVATVEYLPGDYKGTPVNLRPGQTHAAGPLSLHFVDLSEVGERGTTSWAARANVVVEHGGVTTDAGPTINLQTAEATVVDLPEGYKLRISPKTHFDDAVTFDVIAPNAARTPATAVMDVTLKPYIWLVWLGAILVVLGGLTAAARRARHAVLAS